MSGLASCSSAKITVFTAAGIPAVTTVIPRISGSVINKEHTAKVIAGIIRSLIPAAKYCLTLENIAFVSRLARKPPVTTRDIGVVMSDSRPSAP